MAKPAGIQRRTATTMLGTVVAVTTSDAERDVAAAMAGRADKFLTKPADSHMLQQVLAAPGLGPQGGNNPIRP